MQKLRNIQIDGSHGKPILLDAYFKNNGKPKPVVVFSHGFKGFKDWGHFNLVAEAFAQAGFAFIKFNFSHNGTTPARPDEFADLEAFGHNSFTMELYDLDAVINWVYYASELAGEVDVQQIYLLGHSRGGGISILKASEDKRVQKLCTWASVAEFGRFWDEGVMADWKAQGVMYVRNERTKQDMPMYYETYEDFYANQERLDIPKAAFGLQIPYLIVHAEDDTVVKVASAYTLNSDYRPVLLMTTPTGGHTFGARHPWPYKTLPQPANHVVTNTIKFFKGQMSV